MNPLTSIAEGLAVAGITTPATTANTQRNTGAVDMSKWDQVLFVFVLGDMASEAIDFGVESCDSDGTSNAVDITGKQATQLAANASANDGKVVVIAVKSVDLISSGKQYCRGTMVTGGATGGPACCIALGVPKYGPADGVDISAVVQVIK